MLDRDAYKRRSEIRMWIVGVIVVVLVVSAFVASSRKSSDPKTALIFLAVCTVLTTGVFLLLERSDPDPVAAKQEAEERQALLKKLADVRAKQIQTRRQQQAGTDVAADEVSRD